MNQAADDLSESIQLGEAETAPVEEQTPSIDHQEHCLWGQPEEQPIQIILRQQAYLQILSHARSDLWHEIGGVLIGHVYSFADQVYVEVTGALPARSAQSSAVHLTFSAETWMEMQRELEQQLSTERIVGWYHSHPGLGVFLSEQDTFIQRHFFSRPWQLAFVVDPIAWQARFFVWYDQEIGPATACYETFDLTAQTSLIGSLIPVAQLPLEPMPEAEIAEEPAAPHSQHPLRTLWHGLFSLARRLIGYLFGESADRTRVDASAPGPDPE